jgi:diguanylate cyclase (GGDEF)-like protein/PAS domain S-box-containing protein
VARKVIRRLTHGLTGRLALGVLALGTLLGALLLAGVLYFIVEDYKAQFVNNVRSQSRMLASLVGGEFDNGARVRSIFSELLLSGEVVYAELATDDPSDPRAIPPDETQGGNNFTEDFFFGTHDDAIYYIAAPVADADGRPVGTLKLGYDESFTRDQIGLTYRRGLWFAAAYTLMLLIAAMGLGLHLSRPLRQLREASREIAGGRIDRPLAADTRVTEVAALAEDLESMRNGLIRSAREIATREERHRAVLEHAAEGIMTLNAEGLIESFNAAAERIFGCADAEVIGTPFTRFFSAVEASRVTRPDGLPRIASGVTLTVRREGEGSIPVQLSIGAFRHGEEKLFTVVVQDISERMQYEEKLARLAYYDPLTGLPNRRLFHDRLAQALARAQRNERLLGILFFDLDHFKDINDTLGHLLGDLLLQSAARRLMEVVRKDDTVARLGGDEFTVVLNDISNVEDAVGVAKKVLSLFAEPFQVGGQEVFVSTSIGITIYPFDDSDIENLIKNADTAMYRAKALGRNNYQLYDASMSEQFQERLALETALRKAVHQGELRLHYQPQVLMHYQPQYDRFSGQIVGCEALARWQHPELGLLHPDRFIALAEETGLIIPLGEWLLRHACEQSVAWRKQGLPPLRMGVNISQRQLQHKGIIEQFRRVIGETGADPASLEIELTESMVLHDQKAIKSVLVDLKNMGMSIAIDDFGTGHSSLANLQVLPIDTVKIDKSFVHDIMNDENSAAIAVAVIEMAHKLGIRVVAEGVEMEEQLAYLYSRQCDIMQGYFFGRPMPAADFGALVTADLEMQNPLRTSRNGA